MTSSAARQAKISIKARRRLRVGLGLLLALLLIISGKLVLVQGLDLGGYAEAAVNQLTKTQVLAASRGEILDANGKVLAQSIVRYDIVVDQVNNAVATYSRPGADGKMAKVTRDTGIAELAATLGMNADQVRSLVTGTSKYNVVAKSVTPELEAKVAALMVPGVASQPVSKRSYPLGQVAGNVVGFMGPNGGGSGLEQTLNDKLTGKDGSRTFQMGKDGIVIPGAPTTVVPAANGQTVKLTLNADLQYYAQQAISNQVKAQHAEWGNIVVVQVKTGNIIAMAEDTTVDPNNPGATKAEDRGSRIVTSAIEPGSTEKSITAAAAIQEGKATPDTRLTIPPTYTIDGQTFSDAEDHGTVNMTFSGVLAESLNTGTVMVGSKLSPQQRYDYLHNFGIGQKTGIPLPGESAGILATPDKWDGRQQYTVLFGQGVAQTPLQTAMAYQAIANNGVRLPPRLIDSYIDSNGVETKTPQAAGTEVISSQTAQQVKGMLEGVVTAAHYNDINVPGYRVGGKTGTAESPTAGGFSGYTASFVGMAPMENPEYVVLVTVQHPQGNIYGVTQGPVFNSVMGQVLQTYQVPPSTTPAFRPKTTF
ncbi:peptidoglycan D,D-transpeptidase FtsI family protein [Psychromicrobium lacuslunae]|uniref:Peptidoglycan glycosyltransferase n=1 Tax=Psychromicrobium lacuslunae TaxID=1618207 RepID=A0A0D4BW73_9MICC|nr:penicillin-binding protein 2 [Psychromicrobium lacuslunae]AJT40712.1 peptidoglycan glycosyltransferase [Psychromicrobium lacuslunae]